MRTAERFSGAVRADIRYVAHAPDLQAVLVRAGGFILSGSALWALLPVLVRESGRGPSAYGILLSELGGGAVAGAALLPFFTRRATLDRLIGCGTLIFAGVTLASALLRNFVFISAAMLA